MSGVHVDQAAASSGGKRQGRGSRSARIVIGTGGAALAAGIATVAAGVVTGSLEQSASGASMTIVALVTIGLALVRQWIIDTSAERHRLADAEASANCEHARYVAGLAAVDAERARVRRDAAAIARRQRVHLDAERESTAAEFEADRERISTEAFRTGALMERAGLLKEPQPASVTHLYARRDRGGADAPSVKRPS